MNQKQIFESLIEIFDEAQYFIKTNTLPIINLRSEADPHDISFVWKPLTKKTKEQRQKENQEKQRTNRELVNFPCTLCTNKTTGIKNFFYPGRYPILVLHYSGASSLKEKPFVKKNPKQVFKEELTGKVWNELIQSVYNFSSEELYYQEYPACNFNANAIKEEDWKLRIDTCKVYIEENIKEYDLQGIILLGSSAKHVYGSEIAKQMVGKLTHWKLNGKEIPVMTLRSPEALVFLDEKSKQKAEEKSLFHYAEEKLALEASYKEHLAELFSKISKA
jgi:uracil-DNA glycosylase